MGDELNVLDRATLGVWRALHAWGWGSVAFVAAIALHVAFNALVTVIPSGYAGRPGLAWQFGIRVAGTAAIGLVIGWIVSWRVQTRPWLTAVVVGALYTLLALGLIDRLVGLPATSNVEVVETDASVFITGETTLAGGATSVAYSSLTAIATIVAGVVAWRRSRSG